jgi:hypothetical protein
MTLSVRLLALVLASAILTACSASDEHDTARAPTGASDDTGDVILAVDPDAPAETISWRDLMPDDELEALEAMNEGRADPSLMAQFTGQSSVDAQMGTFNVVEDLDQAIVRMPGYILPLDYAIQGQAREFLLLPYHGACVHYPPPPPNQIVYLRSAEPIRFSSLWEPVWVEGRMEIQRVDTDLAASAYAMTVRSVAPYAP